MPESEKSRRERQIMDLEPKIRNAKTTKEREMLNQEKTRLLGEYSKLRQSSLGQQTTTPAAEKRNVSGTWKF